MKKVQADLSETLNEVRVLVSNDISPTSYEFKASGLMEAMVNLLTKTPS